MSRKKNTYEGFIEVCAHSVSFYYDLDEREITDDLQEALTEEAENRATKCIVEGYRSGELNCLYVDSDGNGDEICGWWQIEVQS